MSMRILSVLGLSATLLAATACSNGMPTAPSADPVNILASIGGTWSSTAAAAATAGICGAVNYSITPTGANSAAITFSGSCMGITGSGSGSGTVNGNTLTWTTTGNAGPCPFSLSGTAVQSGASDLNVTYSGTVCGAPISGAQLLHK